jgi:putative nucleotidyltransferase with HDIG domain
MNGISEKQRLTEFRNYKLRWLMLIGLTVLGVSGQMRPCDWAALVVATIVGAAAMATASNKERYERIGYKIGSVVRGFDCAFFLALSLSGNFRSDNVWLGVIPALILEATTQHSTRRLLTLTLSTLTAAVVVFGLHAIYLSQLSFIVCVTAVTSVFSYMLMGLSAREHKLDQHNRRFAAMISCSSALASSRDLIAMLSQILKYAVQEVGGDSGYVMVVDEERPNLIRTEVAYGGKGEFEIPESLEIGEGLSGYVVDMSQPIALRNKDREPVECDGIQVGVRSVISVPLSSRVLIGNRESGKEQTLGSLTVIGDPAGAPFGADDMEMLCSMGSLMAVAVSNARMEGRQRTTFLRTLESLATALEARDDYTRGHSQRVCEVSMMIAHHLGFTADAIEELRVGTILHDIGKIGVPDAVLNKPGRLTEEEFAIMKSHPVIGYEICKPLMLSEGVLMIIRNHHEKLDGSGYPDHLKGGELPPSLRIVCVADAFDAMSSRRPYRGVMDISHVFSELSRGAGIQFDSVVIEALRELLPSAAMQECYREYWQKETPKAA